MSSKRRSKYQLVLKNDDKNSFQHVITCLMEICNHNYYQAGQCANIVHTNGQCCVYVGWKDEVEEVYELMQAEGLKLELVKHTGR
jgi:ATP-dependent Clp protease adaptor protein ClpS